MKLRLKVILTFFFLLLCYYSIAQDITGVWFTKDMESKIEISKNGNFYTGKVIWIKEKVDPETGKPHLDKYNPDEKLKTRFVLNLNILTGLTYNAKDNEWQNGQIYDPKSGNSYKCFIKLKDRNTLLLRGYIGFSLFGRTETWERAVDAK